MIYTQYGGGKVEFVAARQVTVPSPVKGRPPIPGVWQVKAKLLEPYPDGSGKVGELISGGEWLSLHRFVADGGLGELEDACLAVAEGDN